MSGFNYARAEVLARRLGISFHEACRRIGQHGARVRRDRRRQCACVELPPSAGGRRRVPWWRRDEFA